MTDTLFNKYSNIAPKEKEKPKAKKKMPEYRSLQKTKNTKTKPKDEASVIHSDNKRMVNAHFAGMTYTFTADTEEEENHLKMITMLASDVVNATIAEHPTLSPHQIMAVSLMQAIEMYDAERTHAMRENVTDLKKLPLEEYAESKKLR